MYVSIFMLFMIFILFINYELMNRITGVLFMRIELMAFSLQVKQQTNETAKLFRLFAVESKNVQRLFYLSIMY